MNLYRSAAIPFFLNALIPLHRSLELRTTPYSKRNLDMLLTGRPVAITFSRTGVLNAERLLGGYLKNDAVFHRITPSRRISQWRCYSHKPGEWPFQFKELVDDRTVLKKAAALVKKFSHDSASTPICALVPNVQWASQHDARIRSILWEVIVHSLISDRNATLTVKDVPLAPAEFVDVWTSRDDDVTDRKALIRMRRKMLEEVGSYSSEDLAGAAESITTNPSQFAADRRRRGELFGVRFGREWRYPKFQFDSARHIIREMTSVLKALSPDEQGWDRLQWFLEPHEALGGHPPLKVWKKDRHKVVEAANTERWDGRD
jgi:hypothetical protein